MSRLYVIGSIITIYLAILLVTFRERRKHRHERMRRRAWEDARQQLCRARLLWPNFPHMERYVRFLMLQHPTWELRQAYDAGRLQLASGEIVIDDNAAGHIWRHFGIDTVEPPTFAPYYRECVLCGAHRPSVPCCSRDTEGVES